MENQRRIGVALFGLGRAGKIHIGNIVRLPQLELRWIVEMDDKLAGDYIQNNFLESTKITTPENVQQVFQDPRVDIVIIASPTYTHFQFVIKSLEAGKHVFCEKPLAVKTQDVKLCYEIAQKYDRQLFCAFNRRFDESFLKAREAAQRGDIGRVFRVKTVNRDSPPPTLEYLKTSGGLIHDTVIHEVDTIMWVTGEVPEFVYGCASTFCDTYKEFGDYDSASVILSFASGTIGITDTERICTFGYDQRLEIHGEFGMLKVDNEQENLLIRSNEIGCHGTPFKYSFPQRYEKAYVRELMHFVDAVLGKCVLSVAKQDTVNALMVVEAIERSIAEGRRVFIEEIKKEYE